MNKFGCGEMDSCISDTRWYQKLIWALAAACCTVIGWFCKQGN